MSNESKIRGYEDLIAWQKARELTKTVYQISNKGSFAKDFGLVRQIQRASVSVMSNIAEGLERATLREFLRFLAFAKASCAEVRSHLYIAHDVHYLSGADFKQLYARAQEVSRIIGGLRTSLLKKL